MSVQRCKKELAALGDEMRAAEDKLETMKSKRATVNAKLDSLQEALEQAECGKREILKRVAIGDAEESDLAAVRDQVSGFQRSVADEREMLAAIEQGIKNAQQPLEELCKKIEIAQRELFKAVRDDLVKNIEPHREAVLDAFAAVSFISGASFDGFLIRIFGPLRMEDHLLRRSRMKEKYLG